MDFHETTAQVLNSWKEIAQYLGRAVRTVQRWEQELGLPVRRPRRKKRSAVIAVPAELDAWLASSLRLPTCDLDEEAPDSNLVTILAPTKELILLSHGLRAKSDRLRRDVSVTLLSVLASIKRLQEWRSEDDKP